MFSPSIVKGLARLGTVYAAKVAVPEGAELSEDEPESSV